MKKIIGCFCFKQTKNRNLIGEYTNNNELRIFTESADYQNIEETSLSQEPFIGRFFTTWQEKNKEKGFILDIHQNKNSSQKYQLEWLDNNNKSIFKGEGFVFNELLIGYYEE